MADRCRERTRATSLFALMLAVFTVSLGYGIVVPLLPYLIDRVLGPGASAQQVARNTGVLSALYALALFLFAPTWGRLSDRRGRRGVLVVGLAGFGVTMLFFSFLESRAVLYAERFLSGMFASAVTPVASAVATDARPPPSNAHADSPWSTPRESPASCSDRPLAYSSRG